MWWLIDCVGHYLSSPFLFAEVNGEGQVHSSKYCIGFTGLWMTDKLAQTLIHDVVKECEVMPVHLQWQTDKVELHLVTAFWKGPTSCQQGRKHISLTFLPSSTLMTCLFKVIGQSSFWSRHNPRILERKKVFMLIIQFTSFCLGEIKFVFEKKYPFFVWPNKTIHYLPMLRKQLSLASVFLPGRGE